MYRYYIAFLIAFVSANLIVKHFGATGLWISSLLLIPFDFVCRCVIHEQLKGIKLFLTLFSLTIAAALLTVAINWHATNVALGSVVAFCAAQIAAGLFYQRFKRAPYFLKVNGSDLLAIVFDSIVFQWIAFGTIEYHVTIGQIIIKFIGGLIWYFIIFKLFKYDRHINRK